MAKIKGNVLIVCVETGYLRVQGNAHEEADLRNNAVQENSQGQKGLKSEVSIAHTLKNRHSRDPISERRESGETYLNQFRVPFS